MTIMLETYKRRAAARSPRQVLQQYKQDRFVRPAQVDQRAVAELDTIAFRLLPPAFDTVELAPVCPLGTSSALGPVDQNNVVATARNSEVCSDVTNVLALEAAIRREKTGDPQAPTKLCSSHRQLRAQVFDGPASFAHFRVIALCTAGRTAGNFTREAEAAIEHLDYYVALLRALQERRYTFGELRAELTPCSTQALTATRELIAPSIQTAGITVSIDESLRCDADYYSDLRFKVFAHDRDGVELHLIDGGFTDWTRALLNNNKEFFLTSGVGVERLIYSFRDAQ